MKKIMFLFPALFLFSFLVAQKGKTKQPEPITAAFTVPTSTYLETFDGNESKYAWRIDGDCIIKDNLYQVTSTKTGSTYCRIPFPYSFKYEEGQDWTLEVSMKKISAVATAQWGVEINEFGKLDKINVWMDKFKIKKGFDDLKLVKIGKKLDVYFNNKLMYSTSTADRPEGRLQIVQSEGSGSEKLIIQYDNIRYEVTKKITAPVKVETASTDMIVKIPDANFKAALIAAGVDKNKDGEIQKTGEALLVTEINVHNKNVSSLEGIQHFENLISLNCATNSIATLDLTKNSKLNVLFCKGNKLAVLDLSNNKLLTSLTCSSNQLTSLTLSDNKILTTIECASNLLTTLNVTGQKKMKWLDCRWNKLTALEVTGCLLLKTLKCEDNSITKIFYSVHSDVDEEDKEWTKDKTAVWAIKWD